MVPGQEVGSAQDAPEVPDAELVRLRRIVHGGGEQASLLQRGVVKGAHQGGEAGTVTRIVGRAFDGVVLAGAVVDGDQVREALLAQGIGALQGIRLAGFFSRLGADHMLDVAQLQELAQVGGVQHVVGGDGQQVAAAGRLQRDGAYQVAVRFHRRRTMVQRQQDAPGRQVGGDHFLQHGAAHPGLEAQCRHPAGAGVERPVGARLRGERIVAPVVVAHRAPELAVALARSVALDPRVLVQRHALGGGLTADPAALLGEHHPASGARRRQRRRYPAETCADNKNLRSPLPMHLKLLDG